MDKVYKNRELTGRSKEMTFYNVNLTDDSPISPIQGNVSLRPVTLGNVKFVSWPGFIILEMK